MLIDCDMAKAVRYLCLAAEAWVHFQDSLQESYGGQTDSQVFIKHFDLLVVIISSSPSLEAFLCPKTPGT
jgi:hypothetical protein